LLSEQRLRRGTAGSFISVAVLPTNGNPAFGQWPLQRHPLAPQQVLF
jgi:hypothetical protein